MTALNRLAAALASGRKTIEFSASDSMEKLAESLEKKFKVGEKVPESHDLLLQSVKAFWVDSQLHSVRQARLVSFGLTLPVHSSGQCLMDDPSRFDNLLDILKRLRDRPLEYRRCYQGLLHSYFSYDTYSDKISDAGRINWRALRHHLHENHALLNCGRIALDWVHAVSENLQVFGDDPCAPYAKVVLEGDSSAINELCEKIGITKGSWFQRELILAQIRWSVAQESDLFLKYMPKLLELLRRNEILRNEGLTIILNHYVSLAKPEINVLLRDAAVEFWSNPWLPSNKARWGGVTKEARDMISNWLKRHFIKEFFTKIAEDGIGDPRRANFWLQYVDSIEKIEFALGARALDERDKDMQVLRTQMLGLTTELRGSDKNNNAFVMSIGNLVAVEFGGMGNAFYGYDRQAGVPFDMTQPVFISKDADNSLKRSERMLWLKHQDGLHGWDKWEDMFAATFKEHFGVAPDNKKQIHVKKVPQSAEVHDVPYESVPSDLGSELQELVGTKGLAVVDLRGKNGNLWITADASDRYLIQVLTQDGFRYKAGKGWWK
jgi:EH_Signature domain